MRRTLFAAAAAALAICGIVNAAPAVAEPRCLFQGDWNCEGPPQYNGPLQNTWDVPGTYGGWTQLPLLCPGGADLTNGNLVRVRRPINPVPPRRPMRPVRLRRPTTDS
jgi:hypothetical protein